MVRGLKKVCAVWKSDFAGWLMNYKIYLAVLFLIIFINNNFDNVFLFSEGSRYFVTPYLFPFIFTHPYMRLIIFSCIIFLFANAPFINSLQLSMISRCGRKIWYRSQMTYIFICSVTLTIFLLLFPVLPNAKLIVFKNDWGKVIGTLTTNSDMIHPIEYNVVNRYTVWEAMSYTVVVFLLLSFFLGLLIYLCNILFQSQSVGIIITVAIMMLDWMLWITDINKLLWFSPISWVQISNMAYARENFVPSTSFAIKTLLIIDIILVIMIEVLSKKKDIFIDNE